MRNGRILVATVVASIATLVSVAPAGADGVTVCNVRSNSPKAFVTASGGTCMPMGNGHSNAALVAAAANSPALDLLTDTPPNDPGTGTGTGNAGGGGIG